MRLLCRGRGHAWTRPLATAGSLAAIVAAGVAGTGAASSPGSVVYPHLSAPRLVGMPPQAWERDGVPHTLSVLEMNKDGFRYWGWYGLQTGGGIGLARSNDLRTWTKYEGNPLWTNARWPSVLAHAHPGDPDLLYVATTRNYDTSSSLIVLASTRDGIHLSHEKLLVPSAPFMRNQNPNLFRDPVSGRFYLTFYRGNGVDRFEIVSKSAASVRNLDAAPEKILLRSATVLAAPNLLFVPMDAARGAVSAHIPLGAAAALPGPSSGVRPGGVYFLSTEIYVLAAARSPSPAASTGPLPGGASDDTADAITSDGGEWRVQVYAADAPDGDFAPIPGNPVETGQRACLFQHVFDRRLYGYQCHLAAKDRWVLEEVEAPLP